MEEAPGGRGRGAGGGRRGPAAGERDGGGGGQGRGERPERDRRGTLSGGRRGGAGGRQEERDRRPRLRGAGLRGPRPAPPPAGRLLGARRAPHLDPPRSVAAATKGRRSAPNCLWASRPPHMETDTSVLDVMGDIFSTDREVGIQAFRTTPLFLPVQTVPSKWKRGSERLPAPFSSLPTADRPRPPFRNAVTGRGKGSMLGRGLGGRCRLIVLSVWLCISETCCKCNCVQKSAASVSAQLVKHFHNTAGPRLENRGITSTPEGVPFLGVARHPPPRAAVLTSTCMHPFCRVVASQGTRIAF